VDRKSSLQTSGCWDSCDARHGDNAISGNRRVLSTGRRCGGCGGSKLEYRQATSYMQDGSGSGRAWQKSKLQPDLSEGRSEFTSGDALNEESPEGRGGRSRPCRELPEP